MTPYLTAFEAYHAQGEQENPWTYAMDYHLQHGAIVSTPDLFVMARPVDPSSPETHTALTQTKAGSNTWHVYAAAGDLKKLLALAQTHGIHTVTFQRRNQQRVRSYTLPPLKCTPRLQRVNLAP